MSKSYKRRPPGSLKAATDRLVEAGDTLVAVLMQSRRALLDEIGEGG